MAPINGPSNARRRRVLAVCNAVSVHTHEPTPFAPQHIHIYDVTETISFSPHQPSCSPRPFATTYPQTITTTIGQKWKEVSGNGVCDTDDGERYIADSPGRLPTLKACQEACEDNGDCQSITYFLSGWCAFFSTPCTATKWKGKAISMRLLNPATTTTPIVRTAAKAHARGGGVCRACE